MRGLHHLGLHRRALQNPQRSGCTQGRPLQPPGVIDGDLSYERPALSPILEIGQPPFLHEPIGAGGDRYQNLLSLVPSRSLA